MCPMLEPIEPWAPACAGVVFKRRPAGFIG